MTIMTKLLITAMLMASLGGVATSAVAATSVYVQVAPPSPRQEVVPAHRPGYVWAPGYWDWRGNRHVWHAGSWVPARNGYHYRPTRWMERDGRWEMQRGGWARGDHDHDGVPNSVDRHPNDPRRG